MKTSGKWKVALTARLPSVLFAAFLLGLAAWIGCAPRMRDPLESEFAFLRPIVDPDEVELLAPNLWRIENVGEDRFAAVVRAVPQKGFEGGFRPASFTPAFALRTPEGRTPALTPGGTVHWIAANPGPDGVRPVVAYDPATEALWLVRAAAAGE